MSTHSHTEAQTHLAALAGLARQAHAGGLNHLSDGDLLRLLAEHRWAIGYLARGDLPLAQRSELNALVLRTHGLLHARVKGRRSSLGAAIRQVQAGLWLSLGVFIGSAVLAAAAVLADPVLALSVVPREFLAQIDQNAWGTRDSRAADLGMMLFYWANNLRACFMALGLGVLGGLPAILVLAVNGALLGGVAAIATLRGVGDRLWGWLGPHGVPELGALILCGAIGLRLGQSWLVPGSLRRRVALAEAGRALTPVVAAAALLVVCAAPLEGFVAPLDLPGWVDLSIAMGWLVLLTLGAVLALRRERSAAAR